MKLSSKISALLVFFLGGQLLFPLLIMVILQVLGIDEEGTVMAYVQFLTFAVMGVIYGWHFRGLLKEHWQALKPLPFCHGHSFCLQLL